MRYQKVINGIRRVVSACIIITALLSSAWETAHASGTVSTPTEAALNSALSGGGLVTFTCDGTITITSAKSILLDTVLDASGHSITLSGANAVQMFYVPYGSTLSFTNLTLTKGKAATVGGAVTSYGNLNASHCIFATNSVVGPNGTAGANGSNSGGGNGGDGQRGTAGGNALGGAIYSEGMLSLAFCLFEGNSVIGGAGGQGGNGGSGSFSGGDGGAGGKGGIAQGGAVFATNSASIFGCTFVANYGAAGNGGAGGAPGTGAPSGNQGNGAAGGTATGGGFYGATNCALAIASTTFFANSATGGISAASGTGTAGVGNDGPSGGDAIGGGLAAFGTNSAVNCTFATNTCTGGTGGDGGPGGSEGGNGGTGGRAWGGGLSGFARTLMTNCTFCANGDRGGAGGSAGAGPFTGHAGSTGGIKGENVQNGSGTFILENTIIAYKQTSANHNGDGTFTDAGHNISFDNSISLTGPGSLSSTDPKIDHLSDNGGFAQTCALLSGSPAIDGGADAGAPPADERGYFRYGTTDIGAYEAYTSALSILSLGPIASLNGDVGLFFIGGPPNGSPTDITLGLSSGGTAIAGNDYTATPNTITIPAGQSYASVLVRGISGAFSGTNKTVAVALNSSGQFAVDPFYSNAFVTLYDHSTVDRSKQYVRGSSTASDLKTIIQPVDFETGVSLDSIGGNATNLFPGNVWTNTLWYFDATNTAYQNGTNNRIPFSNPIAAFGSRIGGTPTYLSNSYTFAIHTGPLFNLTNSLRIQVYYQSNGSPAGTINLVQPDESNTNQLAQYLTNGFTTIADQFGLRTVVKPTPFVIDGAFLGGSYLLTHAAYAQATNYYFVVEAQGTGPGFFLTVNNAGSADWSRLYVIEFTPFPANRSIFVDAPHFDGSLLPSFYQGKTAEELTNIIATLPDLSFLTPTNYLTVDASPELRRHPILDQFVKDMGNDPLALANYVLNEIELTDALDYDTNYNSLPSLNVGGVDRSALATFQEGQGSPVEQCALLIYLLRQAGVPATYIYPTNGGLQMLDSQVSKLLHCQLHGALSSLGQTNLPQLISVNYPWVAAYINGAWVQMFPWLKDTEVVEGFNFYNYMPTNYNSGYKWMARYVANDTNILSLSSSDQPIDLLPIFIQNWLYTNAPGLSVDDMGVQIVNRRHNYAQWSDFPKPFSLTGPPLVIESLKTNLNVFNTVEVRVYSQANTNKSIDTTEMYAADLHNRKLFMKFVRVGTTTQHDMILTLNPYSTNITSSTGFSVSANPTWKLISTNRLDTTDDNITFQVTHRRLRFLPSTYSAPVLYGLTNLWGYNYFEQGEQQAGKTYQYTDTFRKGDLVAFCLHFGRVTRRMLDVHAQEIWNFSRNANTNNPSTLDPDVYQGTVAYLLGMSYFNYFTSAEDWLLRLHKLTMISKYQHGFGLLRPVRDSVGNLLNNNVILNQPAVHVPDNGQSYVFNNSLHPDSPIDQDNATLNWWFMANLQGSAAEHAALRSYYQTNAVSTAKLLQAVGTNMVKLNADNFSNAGNVVYHGKALKSADTNVWNSVLNLFDGTDYEREVWITPGIITNGTYSGVAAFLFGHFQFSSTVSGLNGGFSSTFPTNILSQQNAINLTLNEAQDTSATPYFLQTVPIINNPLYLFNGPVAYSSADTINAELQNNQVHGDPTVLLGASTSQNLFGNNSTAAAFQFLLSNTGIADTETSAWDDLQNVAMEPVDLMSGQFYVDAQDLTLPGPMPLQIRRNYESQNLAENQFGFGWKMSCVPFLSLNTNGSVICAAEMDGSFVSYRQSTTNVNLWLPRPEDNRSLNNDCSAGIGSTRNLFNNHIVLTTPGGTNVYTLTGADGSIRTFTQRSYPIGTFTRQRPYLDTWCDSRGNFYSLQFGVNPTQPDYGQVRRLQSSNGNFLGFYYDIYGHIIEAYCGDGRRLEYEYDKYGDLITVTLPDQSQISYQYQHLNYVTNSVTNVYSTHLILEEIKPDGRILKNDYDSLRRVTNQYATVGADLKLVRNATFLYTNNFALGATNLFTGTTTVLDYTNRPTTYFYTNSLIRKIVDALNQTITQDWFETDTNGGFCRSLKSVTDKRGLQTAYLYDSFGNVTNTTVFGDLLGDGSTASAITSASYNSNNLPLQIIDPFTNSVVYVYDTNFLFLPQQILKYAGSTPVSTNFLLYGSVTNVVTVGTNTTTNIAAGVLTRQIRAYGSVEAATNDIFCDGRGFATNTVQYTRTGDPNVTNQFLYDIRGLLAQRTDAAGRVYRFSFDALSRPIGNESYEAGQSQPMDWNYQYFNDNGELTWTDGPRYNPEDYVWRDYDGGGRKIQEIRWRSTARPDGTGVQAAPGDALYAQSFFQFDPFGNQIQSIDPRGNYVQMDYDAIGQMVRQRYYDSANAGLATNGFGYEPGGKVALETNALGGLTSKLYTQRGQIKAQSNPDGSTNGWTYYIDGRPRREIQRNGAYWETSYDDANRKTVRTFHNAAGVALATNSVVLDRRGNAIQRTDEAFNLFTNLFDGLDRLRISAGPPASASSAKQLTTYIYTNSDKLLTVSNALGERTVTLSDPIGRPLSIQIFPTNSSTPIRVTTYSYSPDHQSVTLTNGTGTSAIAATVYSDAGGRNLLSLAYPSSGAREFSLNQYDLAGNLIHSERDSATNTGSATLWTKTDLVLDGLNRVIQKSDRDGAVTMYHIDPVGNVTNRVMPGGLQWSAAYNNAGQKLQDWVTGATGSSTQSNSYTYFGVGSPFAGLLQTNINPLGVACAYLYNDRLLLSGITRTTAGSQYLNTGYTYDARSLLVYVGEVVPGSPPAPLSFSYDAYRQKISDQGQYPGEAYWDASQTWDAAGRRKTLVTADGSFTFGWQADGSLTSSAVNGNTATFTYSDAGLLASRAAGPRITSITGRDGTGRPASLSTTLSLVPKLSETLAYTGDGRISADSLAREDFTDQRSYAYAPLSRRLTSEMLNLDSSHRWTNSFGFDNGVTAGLGALTSIGFGSSQSSSNSWATSLDAFSRASVETNSTSRVSAAGRFSGSGSVSLLLDGAQVSVTTNETGDPYWPSEWTSTFEALPGPHQLTAYALHSSGLFATNASVWFTNNAALQTAAETYNPLGQVTQRVWKAASGAVVRTQVLAWDAKERLSSVRDTDPSGNGWHWYVGYDPIDRPVETWVVPLFGGYPGDIQEKWNYFDPEVKWLMLGDSDGTNAGTWRLYGPDANGSYGGMQGVGGLEGTVSTTNSLIPVISDIRGNVLGSLNLQLTAIDWSASRPTAYGAVPGYRPPPLWYGGDISQSYAWRGKSPEITGYIRLGQRMYDPESGTWLSRDPAWNESDPNYYTFCGGDPINLFDALGSCPETSGTHSGGMFAIYDENVNDPVLSDLNQRANQAMQQHADQIAQETAALDRHVVVNGLATAPILLAASPTTALILVAAVYDQANPTTFPPGTRIGMPPPIVPSGGYLDEVFEMPEDWPGAKMRGMHEDHAIPQALDPQNPVISSPENLRPMPAAMNSVDKAPFDAQLAARFNDLVDALVNEGNVSVDEAKATAWRVMHEEIKAHANSIPARPMDPAQLDQLPRK
jgi:RHS repeat-associated protein